MSVAPRNAGVAVAATQARTEIHPVIQLARIDHAGGASSPTQWYWPPLVGAMEANSPREAAVAIVPAKQRMKPYTSETGPPLVKPP